MGEYKITLDKERTLKYTNRSFYELEKHTGKPILAMVMEAIKDEGGSTIVDTSKLTSVFCSLKFITSFIWAGLIHEKVSFETVIDIVPVKMGKLMELMGFIMNIVIKEFGLSGGKEDGEKKSIAEQPQTTGAGTMLS